MPINAFRQQKTSVFAWLAQWSLRYAFLVASAALSGASMNRRDLIKAIVTAAAFAPISGIALDLPIKATLSTGADIVSERFYHRIDVVLGGEQFTVDFMSYKRIPTEHEMLPAIDALERHIGRQIALAA